MAALVHIETRGTTAILRLDSPPRNGITGDLLLRLAEAGEAVRADDAVRALIVWGGPDHFSGGSDLRQMRPLSVAEAVERSRNGQDGVACLARIGKPVAAAISGLAIGGGLEFALCADYRIAARSARLGFPEVTHGRIPGAGGTQRLPRIVGEAHALDLVSSGRLVEAAEAERIGLVNGVVDDGDLLPAVLRWAERFASLSPQAVAVARRAVMAAADLSLAEGLRLESELYGKVYTSDASLAQLAAFHERTSQGDGHD